MPCIHLFFIVYYYKAFNTSQHLNEINASNMHNTNQKRSISPSNGQQGINAYHKHHSQIIYDNSSTKSHLSDSSSSSFCSNVVVQTEMQQTRPIMQPMLSNASINFHSNSQNTSEFSYDISHSPLSQGGSFSKLKINASSSSLIQHQQAAIDNVSIGPSNAIMPNAMQFDSIHAPSVGTANKQQLMVDSPQNAWNSPVSTPSNNNNNNSNNLNNNLTPPRTLSGAASSTSLNSSLGNSAIASVPTPTSITSLMDVNQEQSYESSRIATSASKASTHEDKTTDSPCHENGNLNNATYGKSILSEINIDELFMHYPSVFEEIFYSNSPFKLNSIEQIENDLRNYCEQLFKIGTKSNVNTASASNQHYSIRI